jgi:hypothetical protein
VPTLRPPIRLTNDELCQYLGYKVGHSGRERARAAVINKIERSNGKLDKWDPRHGVGAKSKKKGSGKGWRITLASLRKIFPELVDDQVELGEELKAKLAEISAVVDEAFARIEKVAAASRKRDEVLANAIRELRRGPQT